MIQRIFPAEATKAKQGIQSFYVIIQSTGFIWPTFLVLKKNSKNLTAHQRDLKIPFEYPTTHCCLFFGDLKPCAMSHNSEHRRFSEGGWGFQGFYGGWTAESVQDQGIPALQYPLIQVWE